MNDEKVVNLLEYIERKEKLETLSSVDSSPGQTSFLLKRVYSYIIDVAAVFTLHTAIISSFAVFVSDFFQLSSMQVKVELLTVSLPYQLAVFLSSYFSYFMFTQTVLDGQTLGQKIYGLKVCDKNGNLKSDIKTVTLRSVGYLTYYFGCGFFHAFYFMNKEKRSFADILSKTIVINSKDQNQFDEVIEIEISSLKKSA